MDAKTLAAAMGYTDKQVKNVQAGGVSDSYIQEQITNNPTVASKVTMDEVNTQVNELLDENGFNEITISQKYNNINNSELELGGLFKDNLVTSTSTFRTKDFIPVNGGETLYAISKNLLDTAKKYQILEFDSEKKWIQSASSACFKNTLYSGASMETTLSDSTKYIKLIGTTSDEAWASADLSIMQIAIYETSYVTDDVEPYGTAKYINSEKIIVNGEKIEKKFEDINKDLFLSDCKVLFLGDSITALTGDRSWVEKFVSITGCTKVANVAVPSAVLADKEGTVYDGNPLFNGEDNNLHNVLGNQVQKIINNAYEEPNIIMIAIGTNSGIEADDTKIDNAWFNESGIKPLEDIDRTTKEGAFRWVNETLHNLYPKATICWCSPIQARYGSRAISDTVKWGEALKKLTAYGGVNFIDTMRCGIIQANEIDGNGDYLQDGLHPNEYGAIKMATYNAGAVRQFVYASKYVEQ